MSPQTPRLKLLCDENLPKAVAPALRELGFDVATPEAGMPDSRIAEQAKKEGRVIITFDSDFSNILSYPPREYAGIIRLRVDPPTIESVMNAVLSVLRSFPDNRSIKGELLIVDEKRIRRWEERPE